jgi:hypothetical protein
LLLAVIATFLQVTATQARADELPEPGPAMFSSTATAFGETLRVDARTEAPVAVRRRDAGAGKRLFDWRYEYVLHCGEGGETLLGGSGRCAEDRCLTPDGREGRAYIIYKYRVELSTGREAREPSPGQTCRPTAGGPHVDLATVILREFRTMKLPGLTVRSSPSGRTLVHLPTEFSVVPPAGERELRRILGHRVTMLIRPVSYRWSFGDGTVRTTQARGRHGPDRSVTHAYATPASVEVSVRTTYRARYKVDGGSAQEIPDPVAVDGPVTVLPVEEARVERIAGPT